MALVRANTSSGGGGGIDFSNTEIGAFQVTTSSPKTFSSPHKYLMIIFGRGNDSVYQYGRVNGQQADYYQDGSGATYAVWENTPANAVFSVTSMTWTMNYITFD